MRQEPLEVRDETSADVGSGQQGKRHKAAAACTRAALAVGSRVAREGQLVMETYKLANEERIFNDALQKEKESPPAKRAKFGTKAMPIDPLAEFIDLCVDICP